VRSEEDGEGGGRRVSSEKDVERRACRVSEDSKMLREVSHAQAHRPQLYQRSQPAFHLKDLSDWNDINKYLRST